MNKKPRILFITTSFPTVLNPGSGIFVFRLIDRLAEWVDTLVLTPDTTPDNSFTTGRPHTVPVRYAPRKHQTLAHSPGGIPETLKHRPLNYISLVTLLAALFFSTLRHGRHAQLIHSNWSISGLIGGVAALFLRRPAIVTLRGADLNRARHRWLDRKILGLSIRLSDRVVCVSRSQHEWLLAEFPGARGKALHIANGVFTPVTPTSHARTYNNTGELRLVSVGSLIRRKGHAHVIRTIAGLPGDARVSLTIVGAGPEHAALHELISSLGLASRITLIGNVEPDKIPEILSRHDVFVLCSYSEGRSNALLEAMASAMPVIATDIPGTSELVNNDQNGILVPCDDTAALGAGILRLGSDPVLRENLGRSALQTILDLGLTWDRAAQNYLGLYTALIDNNAES